MQANGPIDRAFRAALAAAGAQIVSYIPNNAYLVTVTAGGAAGLAGQPGVQSVLPYEPYYKISASLLGLAVKQKNLPDNSVLTLGLFPNTAAQTVDQIKQLGRHGGGARTSRRSARSCACAAGELDGAGAVCPACRSWSWRTGARWRTIWRG